MEPQLGPEAAALRPGWLALLLWVSALSCSFSLPASSLSSLVPQVRTSYNFGRTFLGLDKCNACIGTSICKKFFKEEIRSDNWLASHLGLPPDSLLSYPANYSDDSKIWRPVEIFRLVSKYQNEISDRRICASASAPKTCSIERVLRKTERFQKWLQAKRLTPDLVQIFPGAEGWPLPKYLGSCGRFLVSTSTRPLQEFYDAPPDQAADLAYQLLGVLESLRSNDLNYFFYFTHIDAGSQEANRAGENKDIFSCLVSGCQAQLPSCESISEKQSLVLVCQKLLPRLLQGRFPSPVQDDIDSILVQCGDSIRPDPEVLGAASQLKDILRPLRTCDSRFAYRYPDCKYNDKF
ncbi:divergent protein kinase domain 2B isoform X2 [Homo sapiens]|uniref:divergent protein kinase domain 2B isoform X2 n=1 Tax=Homo sapiens TaxID=9606 RepID=UPI0003EAEFD3|nr:divergent protein kinase domain 2B isoform X2 [Homo sapiens]XP_054183846.1 divergent protein kinase domain 2B isoform X2 [Homo sapiens]|eukprot:XP_006724622.1 deleted in autism-related protein 1 isoform X2 [Homo sapiens]